MSEDLFMPAPPAIERANPIAKRRELAGYNSPKLAPSCRHCRHRTGTEEKPRCGAWDFPVELGGICGSWDGGICGSWEAA